MKDRASESNPLNEIKFSREQGFFDKSVGIRWCIGLAFAICLYLFLHFREVRVEMLELGSVAPRYIVAQVDFSFYDEQKTIRVQSVAEREVGPIYWLARRTVAQHRNEFESHLATNPEWRERAPNASFEEMYTAADLFEKTMLRLRFLDPRTLARIDKNRAWSNYLYQIFSPGEDGSERLLPEEIWDFVRQHMMAESRYDSETIEELIQFCQPKLWRFEEDRNLGTAVLKSVKASIPPKYTNVEAGTRIIDQGEKVTNRHIFMLQAMKETLSVQRNLWHSTTLLGTLIATVILGIIGLSYFRANFPTVISSNRKLFLLLTIVIVTLGLSKLFEVFILVSTHHVTEIFRFPLLVPFAAILTSSLIHPSVAFFVSGCLTVLLTITLPVDRPGFLLLNLTPTIVAILHTRSLRRRKDVFVVCFKAWAACAAIIVSLHLYDNTLVGVSLPADLFSSSVFMLVTAVLVVGLFPLLETAFKIMTDVTLMEYMDPNHELLRRLTIEAPGTYQHSVVVGSLAEVASVAIGANGLFCRVSSLYHDIGKIPTAQYFTENQQGGMNIHQLLTPKESAQVIIAHVSEGVAMARKAGLPEQFIDIIKEHHGTTLVYYFFHKQLELVGGQRNLVDEKQFRYTGPKPRTRESAIIMIADSFEAASRCLDHVNEESLTNLIESLIKTKMEDGQFDECVLTFEELRIIKRVMVKSLLATGHSRVKYPVMTNEQSASDA